jgi:hypothetical protein
VGYDDHCVGAQGGNGERYGIAGCFEGQVGGIVRFGGEADYGFDGAGILIPEVYGEWGDGVLAIEVDEVSDGFVGFRAI